MPDIAPATSVNLNVDEVLTLYTAKRFDEVSEKFLGILELFRKNTLFAINAEEQYFIDQFAKVFLFILSEPKFVISERYILQYLSLNHTISNIVAISSSKTTDAVVEILLRQPENIVKLLTLYSARNRLKLDRKAVFNANPNVASTWFAFYACSYYSALVSKLGWENLREHFSYSDPRLRIAHQIQETYFGSTYAGGDRDALMKPIVNLTVREKMTAVIRRKKPDPRHIAVISGFWIPTTSVYRIFNALIHSLKPDFRLTFIQIGENAPPETNFWDTVHKLEFKGNGLNIDPLQDNDFQVVHYPDIGMSDLSILLANQRIAPIQTYSLGHPVSTFGAEIDYVMSGEGIEPPVNPEKNYSERLVMLPGMGLVHTRPNYQRHGLHKPNPVCIVNLPAWCQKVNYEYVQAIKKIQERAKSKFKIRLFSGSSLSRANDFLPFYRDMSAQLGIENLEVVPNLTYAGYMSEMEKGDIAFDAYHFGGGNTVSDNIFVGVPIICWEGDKWYNRIGPAAMRAGNLTECIVTSEEEFIALAVKLIDDLEYRNQIRQKVADTDLDNTVYAQADAGYFSKAMHYLIDNDERLRAEKERTPIRIER